MVYPQLGLWRNRPTDGAYLTRMNAAETTYGAFAGHWSQYYDPGSLPLNSDADSLLAAGKRLHVYWKPYPSGQHWLYTANGNYNASITTVANEIKAKAPAQIWLTLSHEPENDTTGATGNWSYSAYRAMWQIVRNRFDAAGVTNVTWVCVFMSSHFNHGNGAGQEMINLWGADGVMDGLVNIISQQDYIVCSTAGSEIATKWTEDLAFLTTNAAAGRQWHTKAKAVTEWGADLGGDLNPCGVGDRGTDAHRRDTIAAVQGILPALEAANVVELRYFDARSDYINDAGVDGAAFQALKDATENEPPSTAGLVSSSGGNSGTGTYPGGGSGTVTCAWEGGFTPQDGDTAFLCYRYGGDSLTGTPPAGYATVPIPGLTYPFTQGTSSRGYLWRKTLTNGEAPPTFGVSGASTGGWDLLVFRGVGSGAYQAGVAGGTSTTITLPTLTGVKAQSNLAVFASARVAAGSAVPTDIIPAGTYTEHGDHATSRTTASNQNLRLERSARTITSGGAYGGDAYTISGGTGHATIAFLVEVLAGQAVTLPTDPAVLDPAVATPEDHAAWHSVIHDALAESPAQPSPVSTAMSGHRVAHAAIGVLIGSGLPLNPAENDPDHPDDHAIIHAYVNALAAGDGLYHDSYALH